MKNVYDYEKKGDFGKIESIMLMSKSPRRRDLLSFLNPRIDSVEIDERKIESKFMEIYKDDDFITRAGKTCAEIAKAKGGSEFKEKILYISADTIVVCNNKIYGKPTSLDEARGMFLSYFGKSHHVITSVSLRTASAIEVFYSIAEVRFVNYYKKLDKVIDSYLNEENVMDKAGAYGIQDLDPRLVAYICGDINTIIGLPVAELAKRIGDII